MHFCRGQDLSARGGGGQLTSPLTATGIRALRVRGHEWEESLSPLAEALHPETRSNANSGGF